MAVLSTRLRVGLLLSFALLGTAASGGVDAGSCLVQVKAEPSWPTWGKPSVPPMEARARGVSDSPSLEQPRAQPRAQPKEEAQGWVGWKICTDDELKAYSLAVEEYHQKQKDEQAEQWQKKLDEVNATFSRFMEPFRNASKPSWSVFKQAMKPAARQILQHTLQQVLRPLEPYRNYSQVDLGVTLAETSRRMELTVTPLEQAIWEKGVLDFDRGLTQAIEDTYPKLATFFPNVSKQETPMDYITTRVLPVMVLKDLPALSGLLLLLRLPGSEESLGQFVNHTVLPFVDATLPRQCQTRKLITDMALGTGDVNGRVQKFLHDCRKALDSSGLVSSQKPEKPPRKDCVTCEEVYHRMISDSSNSNACPAHCSPAALACMQGMSDGCLHAFSPCLRCHRNRLEQLDKCTGNPLHKDSVAQLTSVHELLLDGGSVEDAKADHFFKRLSDLLVPQPHGGPAV